MADMKTQGTHAYAFDGTELLRLECLTSIDFGTDSTTRIENTCLDETQQKSYLNGLSDPGEGTLGFNVDIENASHLKLIEWAQEKKEGIQFFLGASDGTAPPTVTTGNVTLPTTRTWWSFTGGVSTPAFTFEADSLVGGTVTLQRSSVVVMTPKT